MTESQITYSENTKTVFKGNFIPSRIAQQTCMQYIYICISMAYSVSTTKYNSFISLLNDIAIINKTILLKEN